MGGGHSLPQRQQIFLFPEDKATVGVFHCLSHAGRKNPDFIRMVKLKSWAKSKVFWESAMTFGILMGEDGEGYAKKIREILLKLPELFWSLKKGTLLGMSKALDTVIHLKPTALREGVTYKNSGESRLLLRSKYGVSDICSSFMSTIYVHPSLVANRKEFSEFEDQLKERRCRLDPDIGEQLSSLFGWTLGREILYMDGKLDVKQRQISINSLNDPRVMLSASCIHKSMFEKE
ncbi:hypothetical protein HAX54_004106 [Datura stramonium]|uniref:Uncharacterized protein n=1 Tax=Datura stramonium TaxID=4076 RepID=A0ABS8WSM3_DATST|nr:hypothetical protein [Datura stramonium]